MKNSTFISKLEKIGLLGATIAVISFIVWLCTLDYSDLPWRWIIFGLVALILLGVFRKKIPTVFSKWSGPSLYTIVVSILLLVGVYWLIGQVKGCSYKNALKEEARLNQPLPSISHYTSSVKSDIKCLTEGEKYTFIKGNEYAWNNDRVKYFTPVVPGTSLTIRCYNSTASWKYTATRHPDSTVTDIVSDFKGVVSTGIHTAELLSDDVLLIYTDQKEN